MHDTTKEYLPVEDGAKKACLRSRLLGRKRLFMTVITAVMLVALTAVTLESQICYAVTFNGESVGSVRSRDELNVIVKSAENELTEILGYEYSFEDKLNVSTELSVSTDNAEDIEEVLISSVDSVQEKYAVKVDGETIAALESDEGFQDMLDGFVDQYTSYSTNSAYIIQNVSLEYTFVSEDDIITLEELSQMLDPANSQSENSLSVRTMTVSQHTETVPFEHKTYEDNTIYEGDTAVKTAGVDGSNLVTVSASYVNGVPVSEIVIETSVISNPISEVVAVGTAPRPSTASYGEFTSPTSGTLTSYFGYRSGGVGSSYHQGVDICGEYGQNIYAVDGGEVIYADWMDGYGYYIQIRHDDGTVTAYGHNSELLVSAGERVARGQAISLMGSTGTSTANHLHFEVIIGGTNVDPLEYLKDLSGIVLS